MGSWQTYVPCICAWAWPGDPLSESHVYPLSESIHVITVTILVHITLFNGWLYYISNLNFRTAPTHLKYDYSKYQKEPLAVFIVFW